jgi:hypothetical protein
MNWRNLRRLAREGTAELYQELRRHSASQSWQDYLRTATITDLLGEDQNEPLAHEALEKLQEILRSYDAMLNANDLRSIHGRPGFQKVHAALKELVRPPLAHQRQLVVASARDLRSELVTLGRKGEDWALYLQLSSPIFKDVDYDPGSESRDGFEQLTEIISRFDRVSVDPQFTLISELAGFQATHANLVTYRDMWPNDDRGEVQPKDFDGIEPIPLPIEELPIPAPNQ